jgi:hypothetical protein
MSTEAPVLAEHAAKLADDRERDYLLYWVPRLAARAKRAHSTKIEWMQDVPRRSNLFGAGPFRYVERNYTEIFMGSSPEDVIKRIEDALDTDWPPILDLQGIEPRGQMGGIAHYVKNPKPENVELLVLRDLHEREAPTPVRWLCELTVRVWRETDIL